MGWERQARNLWACISYVLVLFASILAFDIEPTNNSERLVPSLLAMIEIDQDASDPGPSDELHPVDVQTHVDFNPVRLRSDVALRDGPCAGPQCAYHFDARGPPRQG